MRSLQQFWSVRRMGDDRVSLARLGPLRLWLARAEKEWGWAHEQGEANDLMDIAQVPEDVVPSKLHWVRTLFQQAPREYALRPVFPDRPVVVKPEHPVTIPVGESGIFYAQVPVFVQVVACGSKEVVLGTVASRRLSDTWFGSPMEGEICYSLPQPAQREIAQLAGGPHNIVCPLEIENRSNDVLHFEKLCLRPRHAGLYCGATRLWSGHVQIQHEGGFKGATIRYATGQPDHEEGLTELFKPARRDDRGLSRLTFSPSYSGDIIFGR